MNLFRNVTGLFSVLLCLISARQGVAQDDTLRAEVSQLERTRDELAHAVARQELLLIEGREMRTVFDSNERSRQTLQEVIRTRYAILEQLRHWTTASLIIGNQKTSKAAAFLETNGRYQITAIAQPPFQKWAVAAAMNSGAPCRADAKSLQILDDIRGELSEDQTFPLNLSTAHDSRLRKVQMLSTGTNSTLQYLVFHDPITDEQNVAIIDSSGDHPVVRTVDASQQPSALAAYTGGSVWIGSAEEIEPHLETGSPFIEYSALSILETMRKDEFHRRNVAVSIHVTIEQESAASQSPSQWSSRGAQHNLRNEGSEGAERATMLGQHYEDEFYKRLTRHHLPIIEREHEVQVRQENPRPSIASSSTQSERATHVVLVDVNPGHVDASLAGPGEASEHRVSVRLVDTVSGHDIWAASDSRSLTVRRNWRNFIVQSGDPCVAEFNSSATREHVLNEFAAQGQSLAPDSGPVFLIREQSDGRHELVRPLFGSKLVIVDRDEVRLTPITEADGQLLNEGPDRVGRQFIQYAAFRLARHVAPPAVRLTDRESLRVHRTCVLPLGSSSRIVPGSRFRLLFTSANANESRVFPGVASVSDVLDLSASRIVVPGAISNAIPEFSETIAICDTWKPFRIAMMLPQVKILSSTTPDRALKLKRRGFELGEKLRTSFLETLANRLDCIPGRWELQSSGASFWDEAIDRRATLADLHKRGVSHVICGYLDMSSTGKMEVRLGLQQIETGTSGEPVEGAVIDSVRFQIRSSEL